MAQTDPIQQLAAIVNQLYTLAGNLDSNDPNRVTLILQAHDLRGDLVTLVSMQLAQVGAAYNDFIAKLAQVTRVIDAAATESEKIAAVVTSAADLASSIDAVLKAAVQIGATAAKF
jgi:ABC-type transporter Mla subunit MlaD